MDIITYPYANLGWTLLLVLISKMGPKTLLQQK